jgi:hypothetical protein
MAITRLKVVISRFRFIGLFASRCGGREIKAIHLLEVRVTVQNSLKSRLQSQLLAAKSYGSLG